MTEISIPITAVQNGDKMSFCAYSRAQAKILITLDGKSNTYWKAEKKDANTSLTNFTGDVIGADYKDDDILVLNITNDQTTPLQQQMSVTGILNNEGKCVGHITTIVVEDYIDGDFNDYIITITATR